MNKKYDIKKLLKYVWIIYAMFSIFIVIYLANNLICSDIMQVSNRVILNDGWNITINDRHYENIRLDNFTFDAVDKNDIIIMETTIPADYDYIESALCIHNRHTAVAMYIDGYLEYEYGFDRYENGKSTGSGYLTINFKEEYKGKNLRLEYTVTENNAFSKFDELFISEWENTHRYIITENRLPLLIGSFLIVFGVMMTFVQIFAVVISNKYRNVLLLSIFSICIGIWTLCYYNVVVVFAIPLYSVSLMEYMSLFLAPLPIVGYMYGYVKEAGSRIISVMYNIISVIQFALTVTTIALHTTDIVHGASMLIYFQILFIIEMAFFTYALHIRMKKNTFLSKFSTVGLMIVVSCIFYELAKYSVSRYLGLKVFDIKGIPSIGFAIFIGILVMDLYQKVTKSMMEEQEKAILIKRAYTDDLTQLNNRAYCSEYMRKITIDKKIKYTIFNFDLNGLKTINDTYGHIKGDELICYAAIVLDKTFSNDGIVGRMGGDEFIAIVETDDVTVIEGLVDKLNQNIKEINEKKSEISLSMSYGYASNDEFSGASAEKVYHIADERMYAYKQKVKAAMQV